MKLTYDANIFVLSVYPLFKNTEGKHTLQFMIPEGDGKKSYESFIMSYEEVIWFLTYLLDFQRKYSQLWDYTWLGVLQDKAPKVLSRLQAATRIA